MYFNTKHYLKSNHHYTAKTKQQILKKLKYFMRPGLILSVDSKSMSKSPLLWNED